MNDRELLESFLREGSVTAFSTMVERYADMVYGVCRRVLEDAHDAEDASQAVFLVFHQKAGRLGAARTVSGWFYRTAELVARNARRNRGLRRRREAEMAPVKTTIPTSEWQSFSSEIDGEIAALPKGQRQAVVLRYFRGLSVREVASELRLPERTAESRLTRGMKRLRERLSGRGKELSIVGLASFLTEQSAKSAPVELVSSIQAVCLGKAAVSSMATGLVEATMKSYFWTTAKTACAAMLMLVAIGVAVPTLIHALPEGKAPPPSKDEKKAEGIEKALKVKAVKGVSLKLETAQQTVALGQPATVTLTLANNHGKGWHFDHWSDDIDAAGHRSNLRFDVYKGEQRGTQAYRHAEKNKSGLSISWKRIEIKAGDHKQLKVTLNRWYEMGQSAEFRIVARYKSKGPFEMSEWVPMWEGEVKSNPIKIQIGKKATEVPNIPIEVGRWTKTPKVISKASSLFKEVDAALRGAGHDTKGLQVFDVGLLHHLGGTKDGGPADFKGQINNNSLFFEIVVAVLDGSSFEVSVSRTDRWGKASEYSSPFILRRVDPAGPVGETTAIVVANVQGDLHHGKTLGKALKVRTWTFQEKLVGSEIPKIFFDQKSIVDGKPVGKDKIQSSILWVMKSIKKEGKVIVFLNWNKGKGLPEATFIDPYNKTYADALTSADSERE